MPVNHKKVGGEGYIRTEKQQRKHRERGIMRITLNGVTESHRREAVRVMCQKLAEMKININETEVHDWTGPSF